MTPYDYHNSAEQLESGNNTGVNVLAPNINLSPDEVKQLITTKPISDRKMLWTGVALSSLGVVLAGVGGGISYAAYRDKIDILDDRNDAMYYSGVSMLAVGAGIGIAGIILMAVDLIQYDNAENDRMEKLSKTLAHGTTISLTGNGAAITF